MAVHIIHWNSGVTKSWTTDLGREFAGQEELSENESLDAGTPLTSDIRFPG
jgi:hypothetical protein